MGLIYKDMCGRNIVPGSIVSFATTSGRSADLRIALVVGLSEMKGYGASIKFISFYGRTEQMDADGVYLRDVNGHYVHGPPNWTTYGQSTTSKLSNTMIVSKSILPQNLQEALEKLAKEKNVELVETADLNGQLRSLIIENGIEKVAVAFDEMQLNMIEQKQEETECASTATT